MDMLTPKQAADMTRRLMLATADEFVRLGKLPLVLSIDGKPVAVFAMSAEANFTTASETLQELSRQMASDSHADLFGWPPPPPYDARD